MEEYVVSRELAKKLKAAGYPQSTAYGWDESYADDFLRPIYEFPADTREAGFEKITPAPLTDELLDQLPVHTELRKPLNGLGGGYEAKLIEVHTRTYDDGKEFWEYKPADALAQLWLRWKEQQ